MTACEPYREWPPLQIDDAVLDAEGRAWRVLNRPDGSEHADGLFRPSTLTAVNDTENTCGSP